MSNEQVLTVPGRYAEVQGICKFVGAGAAAAGFDADTVFHIELSCDEAATNIIEHAYGAEAVGPITASYAVQGNAFTITLRDQGHSFDPSKVPPPPNVATEVTDVTPEELGNQLQVGGLGLHMIHKLMDEVYFSFDEKQGNTLVMVKRLREDDGK
ncbi:MAG: ATP-binding protein [Chloroflexota bacterium]